eukprot:1158527-Pelagomonas_calceolata.AAC.9
MAPKGKKGGGGQDEKEIGVRNVLQAVLLADSFTQTFRPISLEHPKVLIPLVNVAMIEYTLEWLAMSKVEEVGVAAEVQLMQPSCTFTSCTSTSMQGCATSCVRNPTCMRMCCVCIMLVFVR